MRRTSTITLGDMIASLEKVKDKYTYVFFDFCNLIPVTFSSYRGNYNELSLSYCSYLEGKCTVEDLLNMCKAALKTKFEGYKGGKYSMKKSTYVWVDMYGKATQTGIVGFIDNGDGIIIETQHIL